MEELQTLVNAAATKHADNIERAVAVVLKQAPKLDGFDEYRDELVAREIRNMIHNARHTANIAMRLDAREYGGPAKVTAGDAVNAVARSVYGYMIAGRTLGQLLGSELAAIADNEAAKADGHRFNALLCRALMPLVKEDKTVAECVKESRLKLMLRKLQEKDRTAAA